MSEKEDKASEGEEAQDLETLFPLYAKFGDRESDGTITLRNIDKWLKQAEILGTKGDITNADTAITFAKIVKNKKRMDLKEFQEFIESLADEKKIDSQELIEKLIATGEPKMIGVTKPVTKGAVGENLRRMTDAKLYTGSHKERFDEEGHGKGKEGREDIQSDTGYVSGYKKDEKDKKDEKSKNEEKDKKEGKDKKDEKDNKNEKGKTDEKGKTYGKGITVEKEIKSEKDKKNEKGKTDEKGKAYGKGITVEKEIKSEKDQKNEKRKTDEKDKKNEKGKTDGKDKKNEKGITVEKEMKSEKDKKNEKGITAEKEMMKEKDKKDEKGK